MIITDTTFSEIADAFLAGGEELGYTVQDCNGNHGENEVWCRMHSIVGNGMRWTTARGYLYPIRDRKNLHITVKSHVTKVIIEEKTAVGVDFIREGRKERVKALREVILAAGSVGSPQILLLSGIGPKEYLEKLHIPVVADLPVGENLIDHVMFFVKADISKPVSYTPDKVNTTFNQLMYHFFGTGSLTSNAADEANAFLKTNPGSKDKRPDIQFILVSTLAEHGDAVDHFNYRDEVNKELFGEILSSKGAPEGFSVAIALLHPKSRGFMRLRSSDPFDYPEIDPNYLAHKDDVRSILQGSTHFFVIIFVLSIKNRKKKRVSNK
ncbi:hypothetical protein CHS0354_033654 [Potamilus streckersoni]|uniref:Glucose-methanol-choline oxidoreductase N-terminal domain-containing protein n=1 Tax=Potamilus streckersoni TaxID=2493646 RepID=A0AAE0S1Z2_9BIVA|nr:hypothetical protein CHS0354_033654 [Potamilus streckersoni]